MNRFLSATLYPAAFAAGLLAIAGAGFAAARHHPVALAICALIAAFFVLGAWELRRLRAASRGLQTALEQAQAEASWLTTVPAPLRLAVQQRLDGNPRAALPGAQLAPALAGLLVLLGMLGTFVGLVLTLGGTANALAATADLATLRAALGAPVQGLGLAFSCSVAGVAGSAMLGLMTALARRERAALAQQLDAALMGSLRPLTAAHRRELAQQQAEAAALAMQRELVERIAGFASELGEQLSTQQQRFHEQTQAAYQALASAVDLSLRASLAESARLAGDAIQPAAEAALAGIAREAAALHQRVGERVDAQLGDLSRRFEAGVDRLNEGFGAQSAALLAQLERAQAARQDETRAQLELLAEQRELAQQGLAAAQSRAEAVAAEQSERFVAQSQSLLSQLEQAQARVQAAQAATEAARLEAWRASLQAAADEQLQQQQRLAERLAQTTQTLIAQADAQSRATIAEASTLLQAAGEAPRAAALVVAALREQLSQSLAQDQAQLAERAELLRTLHSLLAALQQAAGEQRAAIDALVQGAAGQLERVGERFVAQAEATGGQLAAAATLLAGSAAELGSLGEGFATAVDGFQDANAQLVQHLAGLETQLAGTMTRSDEQLGYYVAQARELIELCLGSQKQLLDELRGLKTEALAHG